MTQSQTTAPTVGARVAREILRTPAFREILQLHLGERQEGASQSLVRTLLREDPALWMGVSSLSPRLVEGAVESLAALGEALAAMPPALVDSFVTKLVQDLDTTSLKQLPEIWAPLLARALPGLFNVLLETASGTADSLGRLDPDARRDLLRGLLTEVDVERAAGAINALAVLVLQIHGESPDPSAEGRGPDWARLARQVDAGKLRQATVALSAMGRHSTEAVLAALLDDPVAVANLVVTIPALMNDALGVLRFALERLELPEEVLASAIFTVLTQLDVPGGTKLLNRVAEIINTLHRGSTTLGTDEPAFKAVFSELLDGLVDTLDRDSVARAVVALAEDGDVIATTLARRMTTDSELLRQVADTSARVGNVLTQTGLKVMQESQQLPDETLRDLATGLGSLDGRTLGELINATADLAQRVQANPGSPAWVQALVDTIDWERLGDVGVHAATPVAKAAFGEAWRRALSDPERLGRWVNDLLGQFNRFVDQRPMGAEDYVTRLLSAVDAAELRRAWRSTWRLVGSSVFRTERPATRIPRLVASGVKALVKSAGIARREHTATERR